MVELGIPVQPAVSHKSPWSSSLHRIMEFPTMEQASPLFRRQNVCLCMCPRRGKNEGNILWSCKSLTITSLEDFNFGLCNLFPLCIEHLLNIYVFFSFLSHPNLLTLVSNEAFLLQSVWNAAMQSTSLCGLRQVARLPHSVVVEMLICITMRASFLSC